MGRTSVVRLAILAFAACFLVIPTLSAPIHADDPDVPSWLAPNTMYVGIWKTTGANTAPDLNSQIILGYPGPDGNLVLLQPDGKLALRYGVYPIGDPNHSETTVLATRTPDGFKFGEYPAQPEFTCTFSNEGATLMCDRHALAQGREFFNHIEMTRVSSEAVPALPNLAAPAYAPFTPGVTLEQGILTYAAEVLQERFRLSEGQAPGQDTQSSNTRVLRFLSYKGPDGQDVSAGYAAGTDGTPWYVAVVVREANIDNARSYITADAIYGTLGKHLLPFPEPFNSAVWRQYRKQDGAPTIERTWDNEDGSIEAVGAALWGNNPATGPGNYQTFRARLFPGSPHHAARSLYPS
jgi:hypothetical protein